MTRWEADAEFQILITPGNSISSADLADQDEQCLLLKFVLFLNVSPATDGMPLEASTRCAISRECD